MNKRLIFKIIGLILLIEAVFMLFPFFTALFCGEKDWKFFLITLLCCGAAGGGLFCIRIRNTSLYAKEGLFIVGIAWVIMSLAGAVPYFISSFIPDFWNALFESVSGFTTSGISVVADVESAGNGMLLWRSLTHWIGGMGVLVFMLAISPLVGGASMHLMRAEAPGPVTEKIRPRISETAKWLYAMYFVLTGMEVIALSIAGMSVFHAILISFGTLATGGFSFMNSSMAAATVTQQVIVEVFMVLAGINFSLYFLVVTGKIKKVLKDLELRWYLIILAAATCLISLNVILSYRQFSSVGEAIHQSAFGVISCMTSTGFAAYNYNLWPGFSQVILLILMFVGGCAGSTGGGIKVSRFVLMFKSVRGRIRESVNPKGTYYVKYNGKLVSEPIIRTVSLYFVLILLITIFSMIIVSLEPGMDISTSLASVATALNNNGIELKNEVVAGFSAYSWWSRLVFIIDMLIGRLEIFPITALAVCLFRPLGKRTAVFRKWTR